MLLGISAHGRSKRILDVRRVSGLDIWRKRSFRLRFVYAKLYLHKRKFVYLRTVLSYTIYSKFIKFIENT